MSNLRGQGVKFGAEYPYDPVLGVYYARARMYDAADRRFMAVDKIGNNIVVPQTFNRYLYVNNNPVVFIDPTGLLLMRVDSCSITITGQQNGKAASNSISIVYVDWVTGEVYVDFFLALTAYGIGGITRGLNSQRIDAQSSNIYGEYTLYRSDEILKFHIFSSSGRYFDTVESPLYIQNEYIGYGYYAQYYLVNFKYFKQMMCYLGFDRGTDGIEKIIDLSQQVQDAIQKITYVTKDQLHRLGYNMRQGLSAIIYWENISDEEVALLNAALRKYKITETHEIQHFLAQISEESGFGGKMVESLSPADAQSRDSSETGIRYNTVVNWNDPRAAAKAGDSMKYRGAGALQLTWKIHYYAFARQMEKEVTALFNGNSVFSYIMNYGAEAIANDFAWEVAGWAWHYNLTGSRGSPAENYRNGVAMGATDYSILTDITKAINGGTTNLDKRWRYFGFIIEVIV